MSKMECYATDFARKYFFFAALFCSCLGFNALHASPEGFSKGIQFIVSIILGKLEYS